MYEREWDVAIADVAVACLVLCVVLVLLLYYSTSNVAVAFTSLTLL